MLSTRFWMSSLSPLVLVILALAQESLTQSQDTGNITCNLTLIHASCENNATENGTRTSYNEAQRIAQCFLDTQVANETENRTGNFECLAAVIKDIIDDGADTVGSTATILDLFKLNQHFKQTQEELYEYDCIVCLVAKFHEMLLLKKNHTQTNASSEWQDATDIQNSGEYFINILREIMRYENMTDHLISQWVKSFLDVNNWESLLSTQNKELPVALGYNKDDTYLWIPAEQVGGTSGVAILVFLYVAGWILNVVLIRIFIRHKEFRTDSNLIIINVAIAGIMNLVHHNPPIDIFLVNSIHSPLSVTYVFYMIIGLNIFSVMALSCHICLTAQSNNNRRSSGCKSRHSPHVHMFTAWVLCLVAPIPLCSVIEEYYNVSLYVLITYCVFPLCCSTLFSVATSLQLGMCVQSVHCGAMGHDSVRSARARSANTLVALIVVTAISYVPYVCLPFIPPYIGEKPDDHPFLISWIFVWFNSFINPIALYVSNRDFRCHFNKYLCLCCCRGRD